MSESKEGAAAAAAHKRSLAATLLKDELLLKDATQVGTKRARGPGSEFIKPDDEAMLAANLKDAADAKDAIVATDTALDETTDEVVVPAAAPTTEYPLVAVATPTPLASPVVKSEVSESPNANTAVVKYEIPRSPNANPSSSMVQLATPTRTVARGYVQILAKSESSEVQLELKKAQHGIEIVKQLLTTRTKELKTANDQIAKLNNSINTQVIDFRDAIKVKQGELKAADDAARESKTDLKLKEAELAQLAEEKDNILTLLNAANIPDVNDKASLSVKLSALMKLAKKQPEEKKLTESERFKALIVKINEGISAFYDLKGVTSQGLDPKFRDWIIELQTSKGAAEKEKETANQEAKDSNAKAQKLIDDINKDIMTIANIAGVTPKGLTTEFKKWITEKKTTEEKATTLSEELKDSKAEMEKVIDAINAEIGVIVNLEGVTHTGLTPSFKKWIQTAKEKEITYTNLSRPTVVSTGSVKKLEATITELSEKLKLSETIRRTTCLILKAVNTTLLAQLDVKSTYAIGMAMPEIRSKIDAVYYNGQKGTSLFERVPSGSNELRLQAQNGMLVDLVLSLKTKLQTNVLDSYAAVLLKNRTEEKIKQSTVDLTISHYYLSDRMPYYLATRAACLDITWSVAILKALEREMPYYLIDLIRVWNLTQLALGACLVRFNDPNTLALVRCIGSLWISYNEIKKAGTGTVTYYRAGVIKDFGVALVSQLAHPRTLPTKPTGSDWYLGDEADPKVWTTKNRQGVNNWGYLFDPSRSTIDNYAIVWMNADGPKEKEKLIQQLIDTAK